MIKKRDFYDKKLQKWLDIVPNGCYNPIHFTKLDRLDGSGFRLRTAVYLNMNRHK